MDNGAAGDAERPIVLDTGTSRIKAGLAGEERPSVVVPTIDGKARARAKAKQPSLPDHMWGQDALDNMQSLRLNRPVEYGVIQDFDAVERLWSYTFDKLGHDPAGRYVVLTEPPLNPKMNREIMGEIMFETFCVVGVHVGLQAVLSLYASGRTDGLVVDIGA